MTPITSEATILGFQGHMVQIRIHNLNRNEWLPRQDLTEADVGAIGVASYHSCSTFGYWVFREM